MRTTYKPRTEEQQALLIEVAKIALSRPDALEMDAWRTCETTYCIAGWAIHLNRPNVVYLYAACDRGCGYGSTGKRLLGEEANSYFMATNSEARRWLKKVLKEAGEPVPDLRKLRRKAVK